MSDTEACCWRRSSVKRFWKKLCTHFACPVSNDSVSCDHALAFPSLGMAGTPVQPLWHYIQEEWPGPQGYRKMTLLLPWNFPSLKEREERKGIEMKCIQLILKGWLRPGLEKKKNKYIFVRNISKLRKKREGGRKLKRKKKRKIKQKEETTTLPK